MNGKLKATLLLSLMFVAGFTAGNAWQHYRFHRMANPHAMFAEHRLKRLSSELKLSPAQEEAVRGIFQKAHERAVKVNEEVSWKLASIHRDATKEIRAVLTPEQLPQFEKIHQKFHTRHAHIPEDAAISPEAPTKS